MCNCSQWWQNEERDCPKCELEAANARIQELEVNKTDMGCKIELLKGQLEIKDEVIAVLVKNSYDDWDGFSPEYVLSEAERIAKAQASKE